jgi:hypothetical protein
MRRARLVTVSALVVLGLGTAACSSPAKGGSEAIARSSNSSAGSTSTSTSTTTTSSTVPPTTAPSFSAPSIPATTTTLLPPTTTLVPKVTAGVPHPKKPIGPHRCPPALVGKTGVLLGANVVCTHTATGFFWEPAP